MKIFKIIENLLFPKSIKCIICNREIFTDDGFCICEKCLPSLPFCSNKICKICGRNIKGDGNLCLACKDSKFKYFSCARSVFNYEGSIKNLIHNLKYNNKKYLSTSLSKLLYNYYTHCDNFKDIDIILPVPLHKKKLKQRGYNQSELLLESFYQTKLVNLNVIERIIDTPSQTTKNFKERMENLENVFICNNKNLIKNKVVLVIDDVFTTGATCNSIAKTLIKSGAKKVKCLTLANTVLENKKQQSKLIRK